MTKKVGLSDASMKVELEIKMGKFPQINSKELSNEVFVVPEHST
jgi:hypothetical protein